MHAIEPVDSLEIVQINFNYTRRKTMPDACLDKFWPFLVLVLHCFVWSDAVTWPPFAALLPA